MQKKSKHASLPSIFWDEFQHLSMFAQRPAPQAAHLALRAPSASSVAMSPPAKPASRRALSADDTTTRSPASASVRPSPVKCEASGEPSASLPATPSSKGGALKRRKRAS